jgi:hypothetical protein
MKGNLQFRVVLPVQLQRLFKATVVLPLLAAMFAWAAVLQGQAPVPPLVGLVGTDISDIKWSGRFLWVVTDIGLARLDLSQGDGLEEDDWVTFAEENGLGRGGISALDARSDTVWIATVFDTLATQLSPPASFQVGSGLHLSHNGGDTWQTIPNQAPFDTSRADFANGPTTPINNGCFGLSIEGDTIWAAFFAGSTIRSQDGGGTWDRVLPGGAKRIVYQAAETAADSFLLVADSLARAGGAAEEIDQLRAAADSVASQWLLHRTFEVLAYGDTVWIGTSSGIARSFDGGVSWKNIKVRLDDRQVPLPGNIGANWVLSLDRQILADGGSVIWAGTRVTAGGEVNSMAFSRDNGETWQITGPAFAWGFAFTPDRVWAGTDGGLLLSEDQGVSWTEVKIQDSFSGEPLSGTFVGVESVDGVLWAGAENGLGRSDDGGQSWRVLKTLVKPLSLDQDLFIGQGGLTDSVATYAAPNPFAPSQKEQVRIVYSLSTESRVTIKVYDFASRLVRTLIANELRPGDEEHGEAWDGRDDSGDSVANGVYFYRIELDSGQEAFSKVVVLD